MSDTNATSRRDMLRMLGLGSGVLLMPFGSSARTNKDTKTGPYWGYLVDTTKCIGCCACMRACKAENDVPDGNARTWVERYRISADGKVQVDAPLEPDFNYPEREGDVDRAFFVPKICNHCDKSVCSQVCPVGASYQTEDGVVLVDEKRCIGCGYCVQACPYGTRFINPKTHVADKCTLCYHRISKGLQPACAASCPTGSRVFGDLNDKDSTISQLVRQLRPRVLLPEMGTHPKCYYAGLDREVI